MGSEWVKRKQRDRERVYYGDARIFSWDQKQSRAHAPSWLVLPSHSALAVPEETNRLLWDLIPLSSLPDRLPPSFTYSLIHTLYVRISRSVFQPSWFPLPSTRNPPFSLFPVQYQLVEDFSRAHSQKNKK